MIDADYNLRTGEHCVRDTNYKLGTEERCVMHADYNLRTGECCVRDADDKLGIEERCVRDDEYKLIVRNFGGDGLWGPPGPATVSLGIDMTLVANYAKPSVAGS